LKLHDPMAGSESPARPCSAFPSGLVDQTTNRVAPSSATGRIARLRFAFHDGDEIGPRVLAKIAKHTGLTPDDL
jgi:hypothetical protein